MIYITIYVLFGICIFYDYIHRVSIGAQYAYKTKPVRCVLFHSIFWPIYLLL